jgi:hypothetical protein
MRAPRYKDVTLIKRGIAPPDDQRGSASDSSAMEKKVDQLYADSVAMKQHVKDMEGKLDRVLESLDKKQHVKDMEGKLDRVLEALERSRRGTADEKM